MAFRIETLLVYFIVTTHAASRRGLYEQSKRGLQQRSEDGGLLRRNGETPDSTAANLRDVHSGVQDGEITGSFRSTSSPDSLINTILDVESQWAPGQGSTVVAPAEDDAVPSAGASSAELPATRQDNHGTSADEMDSASGSGASSDGVSNVHDASSATNKTSTPECICSDFPVPGTFSCKQTEFEGKCNAADVVQGQLPNGYCELTCGRCSCCKSLLQTFESTPELTTWASIVQAVVNADLTGSTASLMVVPSTELTVFAPTNEAWSAFFEEADSTLEEFTANVFLVSQIIDQHVIFSPDVLTVEELVSGVIGSTVPTRSAGPFIELGEGRNGGLVVEEGSATAAVVQPDIRACTSIAHAIDGVLANPEQLKQQSTSG